MGWVPEIVFILGNLLDFQRARVVIHADGRTVGATMPDAHTPESQPKRLVISLSSALGAWAEERIATEGTKAANARKQAKRLRTFFDQHGWTEIDQLDRAGLVAAYSAMTNCTAKTRSTLMSTVSSFCAYLVRAGHLNASPMATIARPARQRGQRGPTARRGVRPLTNAEAQALLDAALTDEAKPRPRCKAHRSTRLALAWMTGGRLEQIASLRWIDIDLGPSPSVTYDADASKNQAGWRVPLPKRAAEMLAGWRHRCELAGPSDLVFSANPWYRQREFDADLKAAGVAKVKNGRRAGFHSLRKTYARNLVLSGVPVNVAQQLMQHKTLEMTLGVYAEAQQEDKIAGAEAAAGLVEKDLCVANVQPVGLDNHGVGGVENPPSVDVRLTSVGGSVDSHSAETMVALPSQLDTAPRAALPAAYLATGLSNLSPAAGGAAEGSIGSRLDVTVGQDRHAGPESNRAGRIRTADLLTPSQTR